MEEKASYKEYFLFFLLMLIYVVFAIRYSPIFERLGSDKEVFQYIGMLIKNNQYPYTHAFDHKPPVIYLVNYLGVLLTPKSTWGVFVILNSLGFFCTILIYKIASIKIKGFVLPLLIAIAFALIGNSNNILEEANLTRQLTAYFTIIILFIVFVTKRSNSKILWVGSLIGIIFFTQQNEILGGLILAGYYLLFKEDFKLNTLRKSFKSFIFFTVGLATPFVGVFLIINHWDNYHDFLNQVFLFNFNSYIDNKSFITKIIDVIYKFAKIVFVNKMLLIIFFITFFNLIVDLKKEKKWHLDSKLIVLFIALIMQIISTSISGRSFGHYFLMFIPYVICFFIFSYNQHQYNSIYIKYVCVFLIGSFIFQTVRILPYQKSDKSLLKAITKEVSSVENKSGQFYSLNGRYLRVNFNLNIVSPSKHIYAHFMSDEVANEIIEDLVTKKTKYVLYDTGDALIIPDSLKTFMASNYKEVLRLQEHILFERD